MKSDRRRPCGQNSDSFAIDWLGHIKRLIWAILYDDLKGYSQMLVAGNKVNRICEDFEHSVSVETSESICQFPKHGSFSEIDIRELRKVMKKVKDTFSENDPFPVSELKN